jgi:hypothetical protein
MIYLIGFGIVIILVCGIVKMAGGKDYENMSVEEFEAERERTTRLSGPILEFQKIVDASHHVEHVQREKDEKSDSQVSGDPPDTK